MLPLLPWPFCRGVDLDACLTEASALVEEPVLWPDLSTYPPADAGVCIACKGKGEVLGGRDYETGFHRRRECWWCVGTGEEPVEPGHVNHHLTESEKQFARWLARMAEGLPA